MAGHDPADFETKQARAAAVRTRWNKGPARASSEAGPESRGQGRGVRARPSDDINIMSFTTLLSAQIAEW